MMAKQSIMWMATVLELELTTSRAGLEVFLRVQSGACSTAHKHKCFSARPREQTSCVCRRAHIALCACRSAAMTPTPLQTFSNYGSDGGPMRRQPQSRSQQQPLSRFMKLEQAPASGAGRLMACMSCQLLWI